MGIYDREDDVLDMVNGKKYSDDTAFFGIVNNNATIVENDRKQKEKVEAYYASIERGTHESIGRCDRKIKFQREIEERGKALARREKRTAIALALAAAILIPSAAIGGKSAAETFETQLKTEMACELAESKVQESLISLGLAHYDYETAEKTGQVPFALLDNSTQDYMKIYVDDITDVYTYRSVLGEEFDDFIKSVEKTTTGTYYTSYEDYYTTNGFNSEKEFETYCEGVILHEYEDNLENTTTKGGK